MMVQEERVMGTFRKKPVEIEAWHWLFSTEQEPDPAWMRDALNVWPAVGGAAFWPDGDPHVEGSPWYVLPHIAIKTLEGTMRAVPGDWIIKGIKGELYPVKDEMFRLTYEPVTETVQADLATLAGMEHAKNEYATLAANRWTEIEWLRLALNYVADTTYCGADAEWHFKQGYDPQIVLGALTPPRTEGDDA